MRTGSIANAGDAEARTDCRRFSRSKTSSVTDTLRQILAFSGRTETKTVSQRADGSLPDRKPRRALTRAGRRRARADWSCGNSPLCLRKALDEKGVNINSVRERLSRIGEILKATPSVRGEGKLSFEFVVGMKETPADIALWERDGISAELIEQPGARQRNSASVEQEHNPFISRRRTWCGWICHAWTI